MLIDEFEAYYLTRVSNIAEHFAIAAEYGNENAVHDLRVEIKKLRAFYDLMEAVGSVSKLKKAYTPVRRLFKSAAGIRDPQVIQALAKECISKAYPDANISEYFNLLKQKEMIAKKKFFRFGETFDLTVFYKIRNLINKRLSKIGETKIEGKSRKYLKNLLDILNESKMKNGFVEKDFHDIRILCKKIRYTLEILSVCYSQEDFDLLNNSLRSVHQALGQWHDTDVAISFLNEIISDQSLKPLFSESSYSVVLKSLEERKQHFSDLFYERFGSCDLSGLANSRFCNPQPDPNSVQTDSP